MDNDKRHIARGAAREVRADLGGNNPRLIPGFCGDLVGGGCGFNAEIERKFDDTAKALEQAIRTEG
jgi:hypothetical protein